MSDAQPAIVLDKVNKWYGAMHVLRDVSMTVGQGERVVIDGRMVTSQGPGTAFEFALAIIRLLLDSAAAAAVEKGLVLPRP